jgi:hypothetical protein
MPNTRQCHIDRWTGRGFLEWTREAEGPKEKGVDEEKGATGKEWVCMEEEG